MRHVSMSKQFVVVVAAAVALALAFATSGQQGQQTFGVGVTNSTTTPAQGAGHPQGICRPNVAWAFGVPCPRAPTSNGSIATPAEQRRVRCDVQSQIGGRRGRERGLPQRDGHHRLLAGFEFAGFRPTGPTRNLRRVHLDG